MKSGLAGLLIFFLTFSAYADNALLQWSANPDADYYVVYWSKDGTTFSDANSMELTADITSLSLVDSPKGEKYYYRIKACNDFGNSSDFSDMITSAHLPGDIDEYTEPAEPDQPEQPAADNNKSAKTETAAGDGGGGNCFIGSVL